MDYTKILLDGFMNENDREFLSEYLDDELLRSKQTANRFISGCRKAHAELNQYVENRYNQEKGNLYNLLSLGSDEAKEYAKSELDQFNPDNYPANLNYFRHRYNRNINQSGVNIIGNAIDVLALKYFKSEIDKLSDELLADNHNKPLFETEYSKDQLINIFDNLIKKDVVRKSDKQNFLSLFHPPFKNRVFWNINVHGAKAALFDMMERLTGKYDSTGTLLKAFDCKELHDHNKPDKKTRLIDSVMK